ncbi:hypothetical protein N431DRAFT_434813 [Stipitochalara longipes BDJ]|nr:hypothetical protein N431DRAFT_434813 [Stipitochalara longipes BDJ]
MNDFKVKELVDRLKDDPSYLGTGHWQALCLFFERSYWSRLWVIQEIAMSSSDMIMYCGSKSLSWERMCLGMGIIHRHLWQVKDSCLAHDRQVAGLDGPWRWPVRHLNKIWKDLYPISQLERSGEQHLDFKRLLEVASVSECSDPRDRVFGLLTLMDEKLAARILPNYTISTESIYVSVAKAYIAEYQSLDLLRDGGLWGSLDIPSWVPDWTWSGRVRDNTAKRGYDASRGTSMFISFSADENCLLTCRGVKLDTIDGIGAAHIPYHGWPRESITQPISAQSAHGNFDATKDALARALYGGRTSHSQTDHSLGRALLWLPRDQRKAMDLFKELNWKNFSRQIWKSTTWGEWRDANADLLIAGQRFDHYFEDTCPTTDDDTECYDAYISWVRTHHGRRLATTRKGYFGWVPDKRDADGRDQVKNGDLIAIVFGCSTPLVLRSQGDAYRIIGEAYLEGFMEGELSALLAKGIWSSEVLVLC